MPILEECVPTKHKKFTEKIIKETRGQAVCYPNFPLPVSYRYAERLSDAEMQVLKLLCADKSNAGICDILNRLKAISAIFFKRSAQSGAPKQKQLRKI